MSDTPSATSGAAASGWFRPVDGASLAVFRIVFGVAMVAQGLRYIVKGWVDRDYVEPTLHFTYPFFDWVTAPPGDGMHLVFWGMVASAALVTVGLFTRAACVGLFFTTAWWFLIDRLYFNNHYYLQALVAGMFIFLPVGRVWSLDALRRAQGRTVPVWAVGLLRFELAVVYVGGALAKFDPDWLTGVPIRAILSEHRESLLGPYVMSPEGGLFFAYAGLLLDLFVVPALLWRRTRPWAYAVITAFHLCNVHLFRIGVFPWLMIGATTIFFAPDWPRRLAARIGRTLPKAAGEAPATRSPRLVTAALVLFGLWQIALPLRHHLYPGRVTWREEGWHFGWHMMLRHKMTQGTFTVTDAYGNPIPFDDDFPITPKQWSYLQYDPETIRQFAHWLADDARRRGIEDPRVYARVLVSLNGREPQFIVDPQVDLAAEERTFAPAPWIVPLETPLPPENPYGGQLDAKR